MGKEKNNRLVENMNISAVFESFYDIVVRLRGPDGCPWDREQTPHSLRDDLIEETYECIEAIDEKDSDHIKEELGDIFLLVTMLAYMHEQEGLWTINDVLTTVSEKLVRRHPHVFGELKLNNSAEVLDNWAKIKVEQEGRTPKESILDEVSAGLPPLERALKLQKKAAKTGFDWPDINGVLAKITEELEEVRAAAENAGANSSGNANADETAPLFSKLEEELGDLLFSVVNLCRFYKTEPSIALARTNRKFSERFKYVEKKMKALGIEMKKENMEIMDKLWNEVKAARDS